MLRIPLVVLLAVVALSAAPSGAFAAPCQQPSPGVNGTTSWTGGNGNAEDAGKWTNGTPNGNCKAIITAPGTYTVTVTDVSTNANGIDLGADSGTQTIAIVGSTKMDGTPSDISLSTIDGKVPLTIGAHGVIALQSSGSHPGGAILGGDIVNNGLIRTDPAMTGVNNANTYRDIRANVTNNAGANIDLHTDLGTCGCGVGGTWINHGTLTTDAGTAAVLSRTGAGPRFSQPAPGGTVVNHGRFEIVNGGFTNAAGTTSGNPLEICGDLDASGPGAASFDFDNAVSGCPGPNVGTLTGDIAAATTVRVHGTTAAGVNLSTVAGLTNRGTMTFEGGPGQLQLIGSTPFANAGTMNFNSADVYVNDPLVNTGTLAVGAGAGLSTNAKLTQAAGTLTVGAGATVTANGSADPLALTGGTITNAGALNTTGSGSVTHTGGTATGNAINVCGSTLKATGPGTAAFIGTCPQNQTLGGDIGAGDTVTYTTTGAVVDVFAGSFTNRGTLAFQSAAGHLVQLHGETLTNAGTLTFTGSNVAMALVNQGTMNVPAAAGLSTNANQPVTQAAGTTTIDGAFGSGAFAVTGGTLRGAGTITADVTNPGGTVHPGGSPGILTITGTYKQGTGGTLAVDVAGTEPGKGYSQLAVSGAAALAGTLTVANPVTTVGTFRVLTGSAVSGTFSPVKFSGRTDTVSYDATGVTLEETPGTGPSGPAPTSLALSKVALKHGKLSLTLSAAASITVTVSHKVHGHRVHGKCKPKARTGKSCSRAVTVLRKHKAGVAGVNTLKLAVAKLHRGRYKVTVVVKDTAGAKRSKTLRLRVK